MAFTGKLGTDQSQLGNIQLGSVGGDAEVVDVNDTVVVTDDTTEVVAHFVSVSDTIVVNDAVSFDVPVSVSDTVGAADAMASQQDGNAGASDTVGVADDTDLQQDGSEDVSDTVGVTDQLNIGNPVDVADTVGVADALASQQSGDVAASDTIVVNDAEDTQQDGLSDVSDTIVVTDDLSITTLVDVGDTVAVSDALASLYNANVAANEAPTVVLDEVLNLIMASVAVSDTIGVVDLASIDNQVDVSDTIIVFDGTSNTVQRTVFVVDTVGVVDVIGSVASSTLAVVDTVGVADALQDSFGNTIGVIDTVGVADAATVGNSVNVGDTVVVNEALVFAAGNDVFIFENVPISEVLTFQQNISVEVNDIVGVTDTVAIAAVIAIDGFTIQINFSGELRYDEVENFSNYQITSLTGVPTTITGVEPLNSVLASGSDGFVPADPTAVNGFSKRFSTPTGNFNLSDIGSYLSLNIGGVPSPVRITDVFSPTSVSVDASFLAEAVYTTNLEWEHLSGVTGVIISMTKTTRGAAYFIGASGLIGKLGNFVEFQGSFTSVAELPQLDPTLTLLPDGLVVADFGEPMQSSSVLASTAEYAITGPTTVKIPKVIQLDSQRVGLFTTGLEAGNYTLTVNATGTPKDIAGNPIDPVFNQAIFTGSVPLTNRSIFTDKGPIAKPSLVLQEGTLIGSAATIASVVAGVVTVTGLAGLTANVVGQTINISGAATAANNGSFTITEFVSATSVRFTNAGGVFPDANSGSIGWSILAIISDFTDVILPGALLTPDHVGLYIRLSGGSINGGMFRILAVTGDEEATIQASFTLPDPDNGALDWELVDPRNGQIADDPADVSVRINGFDVVPDAVIGLLGQIVLNATPAPADDVKVDYSWICNPTVEVRRLNSKEFRLNSWNRDVGYPIEPSQHKYRYNNSLIKPELYNPDDMQANLAQPLLRELHYRAYERAYTAVLNDPNLLVLNTPIHRIAYPPMQRPLAEEFIQYEALTLPENSIAAPWVRKGTGLAAVSVGVLTVTDNTSGVFPTGEPIFWTRSVDLSFPHVFAMAWRCEVTSVTTYDGVFSGIAAGFSDPLNTVIVGFLEDAGVKKIGFLKRGSTDDPSLLASWVGGFDAFDVATNLPVDFDWTLQHTYRLYRDPTGSVRLFIDGDVTETLRIGPDELPFLEELNAPFDEIQGVFFGSLSRPAENVSEWDFLRYLTTPLNPQQVAPSLFTSYEANVKPENDVKPWTPVGFHGTETVIGSDFLLLDSTSATDVSASTVGLVGADFRGFVRLEPLLTAASEVVLDVQPQLLTHTFGVTPNGLMAAIDNGDRLMQLCFFPERSTPKLSYGGRSFPQDFSPYVWTPMGTATAEMAGRILKITDADIADGLVYFIDDLAPVGPDRVVAVTLDYILEFRVRVDSYTADGAGFCGVFAQAFDGTRVVGAMLVELAGTKYVAFTSDGADLGALSRFAFNWGDGEFHTYRLIKNTAGDLVSLFVDGVFVGTFAYSSFVAPPPLPTGQVSFGSATPISVTSLSTAFWAYCNAWRVVADQKHYVGLWKGSDPNSLLGYHLPLKVVGQGASITGNALGDVNVDFFTANVLAGDRLVVDDGPNRGVYEIAAVGTPTSLTIVGVWPAGPSLVDYRIVQETDWTVSHKYRLLKNPTGDVVVLLDTDPLPIITVDYSSLQLPFSSAGIVRTLTNGVSAIAFGSFEPTALSQSSWDFVRYGITRALNELRIVPPHQVLNQWNVMASPEHLRSLIPHSHTSYKSSSTGIPPKIDPDFLADPNLIAFTLLNEGTPLVPETQNFESRGPYPVQEFVAALNRPEDVLNNDGDFVLNDGSLRFRLVVPDDVLYTCLDVIEQTTGDNDLLQPFCEDCGLLSLALEYVKEVCLTYEGDVLPEDDTAAPTPWSLVSDDPGQVSASVFGGILTYATGVLGTRTVYRNDTSLPDAPGLQTEAVFRLRLLNDSTAGTGDSQVRFGISAPGMTLGLAFVTTTLAERFVLAVDLNSGVALGSIAFDYLDGAYHTYRIVRDPAAGQVRIFIDP